MYQMIYQLVIIQITLIININMKKTMTITVNNDGNKQICSFSENKIKHITQTNQWGYVIETILKDLNKK